MADFLFISLISLFHAFIISIILVFGFRRWIDTQYRQFLWLSLDFAGLFAWFMLLGLQILLLGFDPNSLSINVLMTDIGIPLYKVTSKGEVLSMTLADVLGFAGFFILTGFTIFLVIFVDSAHRPSLDPIKLIVYAILSTGMVVFALLPGVEARTVSVFLNYIQLSFWGFRILLLLLYTGTLYLNAPDDIRNKASIALIGAFVYLLALIMLFTQLVGQDIGLIEIAHLFGSFLFMIAFVSEPKLLFVLPIHSSRLVIIRTDTTEPLFSYSWITVPHHNRDAFFPGMKAVVDALASGLHELHLEDSVLLINRQQNLSYIIVTSTTSKALKNSLDILTNRIASLYKTFPEMDSSTEESETLNRIVRETFPVVPVYSAL
ncbi:MAG: hypothetical protein ACFFFG_07575 [Candidatus Thorarchaeota archaeon]